MPCTATLPPVRRSSPAMTMRSVDLPEPEGPTTAIASPACMRRSTPRRIATGPARDGSVTCTSSSRITGFCFRLRSMGGARRDSLTVGYGLPESESFPAKLEAALKAQGHKIRVVNAGVSGDTASDGLARLDWALPPNANAVIVELGANDAFRG